MLNLDSTKYNVPLVTTQLDQLAAYCKIHDLDFTAIQNDFINREQCADYQRELSIHSSESPALIADYYATTKMYLYELTMHECSYYYLHLFKSIAQFAQNIGARRVLDYGGGVGGLTLYLNTNGINCDYSDIEGETWRYAEHRFRQAGIKPQLISPNELSHDQYKYDLIVSLDCFEHLSPLSDYVALLSKALNKKGRLLCLASFYGIGLHIASNHQYNNFGTFAAMMRTHSLNFQGQMVHYFGQSVLLPPILLRLLKKNTSSGRRLVFQKI